MTDQRRAHDVREDDAVESLEVRAIAVERLTFFADAVIAIAITLLALDLPVPTGETNRELLRSVGEHFPEYLAFLVSFLVVGAHWRGHHRTFRYVTMLGGQLPRLTMYWLLMLVITPFATRVFDRRRSVSGPVHLLRAGPGHRRADVHTDAPADQAARSATCRHTGEHDHGRDLAPGSSRRRS
jgi:hypothetical protein